MLDQGRSFVATGSVVRVVEILAGHRRDVEPWEGVELEQTLLIVHRLRLPNPRPVLGIRIAGEAFIPLGLIRVGPAASIFLTDGCRTEKP